MAGIVKDPVEVFEVRCRWQSKLKDDTITSSTFEIDEGNEDGRLVVADQTVSGEQESVARLSAGVDGQTYRWRNVIETAQGRTWVYRLPAVAVRHK